MTDLAYDGCCIQTKRSESINTEHLVPHLFRSEFSKIATVLIKHFGLELIDVAEDIASDTFVAALESWSFGGIPENPTAWLYVVAKNKARNYVARKRKGRSIHSERTQKLSQLCSRRLPLR